MSVLGGATIVVRLDGPCSDEAVLGALGRKVCDKADRVILVCEQRGLPVARWVK